MPPERLRVGIIVHGRFHAFDLARGLSGRGHEVTLFTNYPRFAVERFGLPGNIVRSYWLHGVLTRVLNRAGWEAEAWLHQAFGRWALRQLQADRFDVIYTWSGVSEEILRATADAPLLRLLVRGSAHICVQARLLEAEEKRAGVRLDRPSLWRIYREEREYALADAVVVLSSFCRQTFLDEGFPPDRVKAMISGTRVEAFRIDEGALHQRCQRVAAGAPLRVLTCGTFSFRKGALDYREIVRRSDARRFQFRFVGDLPAETAKVAASLKDRVEFVPRVPQARLPRFYREADVFLFPTIEDGFPAVLAQAAAAALPILTTPNGAGHDLVEDGVTGFVLPIRSPAEFVRKLQCWDQDRPSLLEAISQCQRRSRVRDWSVVAQDFERICREVKQLRSEAKPVSKAARPAVSAKAIRALETPLALIVQGRFYIFDLARELEKLGANLTVFTNYPRALAARFGLSDARLRCLPLHGLLNRLLHQTGLARQTEAILHRSFARWAAGQVRSGGFQAWHCMSGVAEEVFRARNGQPVLRILVRGSSHITTQARLLAEEEQRAGVKLDRPSAWRVNREMREYELADAVVVLSEFARRSFVQEGFPSHRLHVLSLGSDSRLFHCSEEALAARLKRIRGLEPLRVLTVGTFSYRKGAIDLVEVAERCAGRMHFQFVGSWGDVRGSVARRAVRVIEFIERQPEHALARWYEQADLFFFPTIEDGYAVVLAQAQAAGLPILATPHCAAPEMVRQGGNGWIVPARQTSLFVERLLEADTRREELAGMAENAARSYRPRSWHDVALDFLTWFGGQLDGLNT